jgi:hypothetical protein
MKARCKRFFDRLGHFQAMLLLTVMFVVILTPYALLLRLFGQGKLPAGEWRNVEDKQPDLVRLRRTF